MAKRSGFDSVLLSSVDGLPLLGISCTVYDANNNQATLYTTKAGGGTITQPIVTSSGTAGAIRFWVAPGYYEVEVTDTESPARITTRRIPFNAVAGDVAGIDFNQLEMPNNSIVTNHINNKAVTQGKIGDNAVGLLQSKLIVKENNVITSANGNQVVASIALNPGRYFTQCMVGLNGGGGFWNFEANGGSATCSPNNFATYNTFGNYLSSLVVVTTATTLRVMSNPAVNGTTRRGYLFAVGIED